MSNEELLKKWEDMGFLEDLEDNQKLPISLAYEKFYLFIKDLDDNQRFNHGDLQELNDIGLAIILDCMKDNLDYQINTDDFYRIFFNTKVKDLGESPIKEDYGEFQPYLIIRYYILPDNGEEINNKFNIDIEVLLYELMLNYFKQNYMNNDK